MDRCHAHEPPRAAPSGAASTSPPCRPTRSQGPCNRGNTYRRQDPGQRVVRLRLGPEVERGCRQSQAHLGRYSALEWDKCRGCFVRRKEQVRDARAFLVVLFVFPEVGEQLPHQLREGFEDRTWFVALG